MRIGPILAAIAVSAGSIASAETELAAIYLRQEVVAPPTLSNLDPIPEDLGLSGAKLGLEENRTTGQFLGQSYDLDIVSVAPEGDFLAAAREALAKSDFIIADAPAEQLMELADMSEAEGALIFNASSEDMRLRDTECRGNLLHTMPSHAMRTDALVQFLVSRRWTDTAQITGTLADDELYAAQLEASLVKFGLAPGPSKTWAFDADMRRNAAQEVPLFTQDLGEYDVLLVADEAGDFGRYIAFNTWLPRPVAGSVGLRAQAWAPVVEQWGAAQLQGRFTELAGRDMEPQDYAAWAAMRTLGEAVTRTGTADAATLRDFILSDEFELAGFKGRPLSYRAWNGQLRQPMPLIDSDALVALAPIEGFLHQVNELDSLGLDAPESGCTAFQG
ncbi:ABC transporter substrate-binding protein [Amaricoccus macauensis]|uniref:ABC transporter substrate-binding protein n=1 Tax=Amaricoccus macauensis TaxID=57001 RepID=UPI003C7A1DA5